MSRILNIFLISFVIQVEELNNSLQLLNSQVSEKDQQINEYKTKLENVSADKREEELFKQIADYKEKNNVS